MKLTLSGARDRQSWIERMLSQVLDVTAAIVMFLMMAVTLVDVLGRYLFSAPLVGAFELTELMLAAVIFLGLPLVTAERGHVAVDLLDTALPRWLRRLQDRAIDLLNVLAFGVFAWMLWRHADKVLAYQDTTAVLQIPYAWLAYLMALTVSLSTLALLVMLVWRRSDQSSRGDV